MIDIVLTSLTTGEFFTTHPFSGPRLDWTSRKKYQNLKIQMSTPPRFVKVALWRHEARAMCVVAFELFVDRRRTELCVWTVDLIMWTARNRRCNVRKAVFTILYHFPRFDHHCATVWHSFDCFCDKSTIPWEIMLFVRWLHHQKSIAEYKSSSDLDWYHFLV